MIIRVLEGKGGKDRDLPLSPTLLDPARVLALAEAQTLSVPHAHPAQTRSADFGQDRPDRMQRGHAPRRHRRTRYPAHAAPLTRPTFEMADNRNCLAKFGRSTN